MWRLKGQGVAIITIYLAASIGFSGENIKKMRRLLQIARSAVVGLWGCQRRAAGAGRHATVEIAGRRSRRTPERLAHLQQRIRTAD
eukprot:8654027-Pyramimonas_sp.AAC.1